MTLAGHDAPPLLHAGPRRTPGDGWLARAAGWRDRMVGNPAFRAWAARFPLTRRLARRRTRALFDLCAGFVYAQVLYACVQLGVFDRLAQGARTAAELAPLLGLNAGRAACLLDAAASLRLLTRRGDRYGLGPLGAAMIGNPAVTAMVRHHARLYADVTDPVALLRAPPGQTQLAAFWPYAAPGRKSGLTQADVAEYSSLMAVSQPMVAAQVLDAYDVRRHRRLMDVGGGTGTFLTEAACRAPDLQLMLFDLPAVAALAQARLAESGLTGRAWAIGGDLQDGALPQGADAISLIRVIHDHDDDAALSIMRAARQALPDHGTLLLAEPMAGTSGAEPVGDAYFAFYLLALGSGRARTPARLAAMLQASGFTRIKQRRTAIPLLTGLIVAKP